MTFEEQEALERAVSRGMIGLDSRSRAQVAAHLRAVASRVILRAPTAAHSLVELVVDLAERGRDDPDAVG